MDIQTYSYLGLVAEAHDHLTKEAPRVAVAAEQLRDRGVKCPVSLQSKILITFLFRFCLSDWAPAGQEVVLLLLQHAGPAHHGHQAQQSCQLSKHFWSLMYFLRISIDT